MANFRKHKLILVVRILLGAMFVFSGISGFMAGLNNMQGIPEPMVPAMNELWRMGIFQMIKTTEIVAGLMLVFGFLPQLALLFLSPICIGVLVFNSRMAPAFIGSGIFVTVFTAYLGYAYWDKYKQLFQ